MAFGRNLLTAIQIYWKTAFLLTYPLFLLPIFLMNNTPAMRCLFVVLLMAGYWVTEVLPLAITSLIPMVLFPVMGILGSGTTSECYMRDTNMMLIGGIIVAIAIEYCNLHVRISLHVLRLIGCSPKRLHIGFVLVTTFASMWISNTAATAMMIPIIEATLKELENQGIGKMFDEGTEADPDDPSSEDTRKPSRTTMCYFISVAYAATIGGNGTIVGSGTNIAFKGQMEENFKNATDVVTFVNFSLASIPIMLVIAMVSTLFLQIWYLGLFRPNSKDAQSIKTGEQGKTIAADIMKEKLAEMGPPTFHEWSVGICFIIVVILWFTRSKDFGGWAPAITKTKVKDSCPAIFICIVLFFLPAKPTFIYMFSKDETKRPTARSPPLVTWKFINQKMHWSLIFLIGGGFALAAGTEASKLGQLIADKLEHIIAKLKPIYVLMISSLLGATITQFSSNVACISVLAPVLAKVAVAAKIHPVYLIMPAALSCSFAFLLPASTPPNAIAGAPCNFPTIEMIKVGIPMTLIGLACLFLIFPLLGPLVYHTNKFPDWAT